MTVAIIVIIETPSRIDEIITKEKISSAILLFSPDLTWRDVQYLIAYTSSHELLDPAGDSRTTNGAGLVVSHEHGHGAMDAEAMVSRARHWMAVPAQQSAEINHANVDG